MAQVVKLKRSSTAGNAPTSGQMVAGELAMNTADGKLFLRDDSDVRPIITVDNEVTGSINLIGNITASGIISASGNIYGGLSLTLDNKIVLNRAGGSGLLDVGPDSDFTTIRYGKNGNPNHDFKGNITASSNISSSGTSDNFFGGRLVLDNSKYVASTVGGTTRNILGIDGSFVTQVASSNLATNIKGTSITASNNTLIQGTLAIDGIADVSASIASAGGGGAVATYTNGSDNRIITSTGTDGINGEANLTFDGTSLTLTGNITASGNVSASGTIVGSNLSGTNTGDQDLSSYIQNSQTSSMSVATASYVAGANVDGAVSLATVATTAIAAASATNATNATNASYVNVASITADTEYGVVFRDGSSPGNQQLYADSEEDTPSWNPSTNVFTTPNLVATTISSSGTSDNFFGGRLVLDNSKYVAGTETGGTTRNILSIDGSNITQVANGNLATNIKGTSISIDNALTVDTGNITVTNGNVHLDTNNTQITGKLTGGTEGDLIGINASDSVVVGNTTADSITLVGNTELQGNLNISQTTNSNVIITGSITHKFPDATYTYQGELSPLAGTLLTAGEVYHYSGSGWIVADASDDTATKHLGVAVSATEVMIRGYIRNTVYAGLGTGNVLYLSTTAGDVTITPPSTAGEYVRVLGYCVEGTTRVIYFNPSQDWIEL